jgi:hypothetical protein
MGGRRYPAVQWRNHFEDKHPEHKNKLTDLLVLAYAEYALTFKSK